MKSMLLWSVLFAVVSLSVMFYFSATKTIVIAEEAPSAKKEGTVQKNEKFSEALQLQTDGGILGIVIPLPKEIKADNITIENRYIENMIVISIDGSHGDFYRQNILHTGSDAVVSEGYLAEEKEITDLMLVMTGIYEHQYVFENSNLYLSFMKPNDLYEKIVVLDAAHGGTDTGYVGNGIVEKDILLGITESVREKTKDSDIRVYCTRTDDTLVSEEEKAEFANAIGADLLISVRGGADESSEKVYGIQAFYNADYFIPYFGNIELADLVERNVVTGIGGKANGLFAAEDDVLLSGVQMPATAIEIGYLSNVEEASRLALPEYRSRIADGMITAIQASFAEMEQNP